MFVHNNRRISRFAVRGSYIIESSLAQCSIHIAQGRTFLFYLPEKFAHRAPTAERIVGRMPIDTQAVRSNNGALVEERSDEILLRLARRLDKYCEP
jgi:hypothetical protein